MQTKEQFNKCYKELADKILLPFLVEQHKKHTPKDEWLQKVDSSKVSRDELLKHYNYDHYYYDYYEHYYYDYNSNNYYYNNNYYWFPFIEFTLKIIEVNQLASK